MYSIHSIITLRSPKHLRKHIFSQFFKLVGTKLGFRKDIITLTAIFHFYQRDFFTQLSLKKKDQITLLLCFRHSFDFFCFVTPDFRTPILLSPQSDLLFNNTYCLLTNNYVSQHLIFCQKQVSSTSCFIHLVIFYTFNSPEREGFSPTFQKQFCWQRHREVLHVRIQALLQSFKYLLPLNNFPVGTKTQRFWQPFEICATYFVDIEWSKPNSFTHIKKSDLNKKFEIGPNCCLVLVPILARFFLPFFFLSL